MWADWSKRGMITQEKVLGTIFYAANVRQNYRIDTVFLTNSQVLGVPTTRLPNAQKAVAAASFAGWFLAGLNPSAIGGLGGLMGLSSWNKLKKQMEGQPMESSEQFDATAELYQAATVKLPYEKVKEVEVKKPWGTGDIAIFFKAGFIGSEYWYTASQVEKLRAIVNNTPLASKLKS